MPATTEELEKDVTALKETVQQLLVGLQDERDERQRRDSESAPAGTIAAFGGGSYEAVPRGWLACNGASVTAADYPKLFAAIGTAWGQGDNPPQTFNLPDLRGQFLRGLDGGPNGANHDPDWRSRTAIKPGGNKENAVGSAQMDSFAAHSHPASSSTSIGNHSHQLDGWAPMGDAKGGGDNSVLRTGYGGSTGTSGVALSASTTTAIGQSGGSETRPKNVYVVWVIKADPK